jgi:hypothetical protein
MKLRKAFFSKGFFIEDKFNFRVLGRSINRILETHFHAFLFKYKSSFTFSYRNEYILAGILMLHSSGSFAQEKIRLNPVVVNKDFKVDLKNTRIFSAKIEKDILKLEVSYCKKRELQKFKLVSNGLYEESFPPGITLFLDTAPAAICNKELKSTINFDLSPLRYKGSKQLRIKLEGFKEPIIYKYEQ